MLSKKITESIVTVGFIGKIKYCPGTFGSLPAFPLAYIIMHFVLSRQIVFSFSSLNPAEAQIITLLLIGLMTCVALFIIGVVFSSIYSRETGKEDPKEVVIDELAGQLLVITMSFFSVAFIQHSKIAGFLPTRVIDLLFLFALPFGLFRLFDILKPWPINWADKNVKGGLGIMLDDILAAIFAIIMQYAIVFILLDWFALEAA